MKFKTLTGSRRRIQNIRKYLINWEKKSKSNFQFRTKKFLKKYWLNHVVFEELPVAGTKLSLDFYNANEKIAVEVQGEQHIKFVKFFHRTKASYIDQKRRDAQKKEFCVINNIKLVEIFPKDKINKSLFKKFDINL
jgi:very-short-patch-repair endonuclease